MKHTITNGYADVTYSSIKVLNISIAPESFSCSSITRLPPVLYLSNLQANPDNIFPNINYFKLSQFRTSHKSNHKVYTLLCPASFAQNTFYEIHSSYCMYQCFILFYDILFQYSIIWIYQFIHFHVNEHLGCLLFGATNNQVSTNIHI